VSALERNDMQGLLLSAYGHLPWSANVVLRIDAAARARGWLGSLAGSVTSALGKHRTRGTNVALTYCGLRALGLGGAAGFPLAFVDGMASARRARLLGDCGASAPGAWSWGSDPDSVHVLLMLFADEETGLAAALAEHRAAFAANGLHEIVTLATRRHRDGKEHFGFSDGIAQPAIRGERSSEPARRRTNPDNDVAAGEFVLGYRNEYGRLPDTPAVDAAADPGAVLAGAGGGTHDLGRNGSYLVFRQIEQDVAAFWRFLDDRTRGSEGSDSAARERLAAKFLGRWPSGAPLVQAPLADDPQLAAANDFGFAADRRGLSCPVGAHIRRANPRDGFADEAPRQSVRRSNRHRLLRRGRPYGPRIANVLEDDGASRGLAFICLNSDIERQFEFVQQTWINNVTFCGLANEVDPLVGAQNGSGFYTIADDPLRARVKGIPRFVTTKGGAYFFLPGLRALRFLASLEPVAAG
jgi:Dyp-type peroxidase family